MKRFIVLAVFVAMAFLPATANAQLTYMGQIMPSGVKYYKDSTVNPPRFWTVTLGQVNSNTWGVGANKLINSQAPGWRRPTFLELQHMYNVVGGGPQLNFQNGLFDYYETSDNNVLANAFGNGIQTPQQRAAIGKNWVIATWP